MEQLEKFPQAEDVKYKRIFGGAAMPGAEAAGFIVVIGETRELFYEGKPKYILLDERESWDGKELVESVGWLDFKYRPEQWYGDYKDPVLDKFVREFNDELTVRSKLQKIKFSLPGLLLGKNKDIDQPFALVVPVLNQLLGGSDRNPDKKRLFILEGSRLMTYMKSPELGAAASMKFDTNPAVTALAFVILEFEHLNSERQRRPQPDQETDNTYDRF